MLLGYLLKISIITRSSLDLFWKILLLTFQRFWLISLVQFCLLQQATQTQSTKFPKLKNEQWVAPFHFKASSLKWNTICMSIFSICLSIVYLKEIVISKRFVLSWTMVLSQDKPHNYSKASLFQYLMILIFP